MHTHYGRRQTLLRGIGPSPLQPSLHMSPATPLRSLKAMIKAMMTATNASLPLDLKPASKRISNRYDAFVSIEVEDMVNCSPKCAKLLPTMICCYIAYDFDDFTLLSRQRIECIICICINQRSWHKHQLLKLEEICIELNET